MKGKDRLVTKEESTSTRKEAQSGKLVAKAGDAVASLKAERGSLLSQPPSTTLYTVGLKNKCM